MVLEAKDGKSRCSLPRNGYDFFFFFFFFPIMLSGLRSLGVCLFNPIECIIIYPDYYA